MTTGSPLVAGVELGGTKCLCILAEGPGRIVQLERFATDTPEITLANIRSVLSGWQAMHDFAAIGIAGFGPLVLDRAASDFGHVINTPKPGWNGTALLSEIASGFDLPVEIDSDVAGAALAEARWGSGQDVDHLAYVTIGTGIGVGMVSHGRIIHGAIHSEMGHLKLARSPDDHWPGHCPYHGDCVEGLIAGPALAARLGFPAQEAAADHAVWHYIADTAAGLCAAIILCCGPQRIILGGGVMSGHGDICMAVEKALKTKLNGYGLTARLIEAARPYICAPALAGLAGPLGAIALGLQALDR